MIETVSHIKLLLLIYFGFLDDAHSYNNDELALINNRIHTIKDSTCTDVHEIDINVKDEDNDDADDGGYDETEGLIIKGENGIDMDNVRTVDDILEKMFN